MTTENRDEWLKARRTGIGSSDAPSIVGVRRDPSRFQIFLDKRGDLEPREPNEAMQLGLLAEPFILAAYTARTGSKIVQTQIHLRGDRHPFMMATVDAIDDRDEIVECKLAGAWTTRKLPDDGDAENLPEAWLIQGQHQLAVTGHSCMTFAVMTADPSLRLYRLQRNDELIRELIVLEADFWDCVIHGRIPTEFEPEDAGVLTKYFNRSTDAQIELEPDRFVPLVKTYQEKSAEATQAGKDRDRAKASLLAAIGNHTTAKCGAYTLRRSVSYVEARVQQIKAYSSVRFTVSNGEKTNAD